MAHLRLCHPVNEFKISCRPLHSTLIQKHVTHKSLCQCFFFSLIVIKNKNWALFLHRIWNSIGITDNDFYGSLSKISDTVAWRRLWLAGYYQRPEDLGTGQQASFKMFSLRFEVGGENNGIEGKGADILHFTCTI